MRITFVGSSSSSCSVNVSAQRTIDWIPGLDPDSEFQAAFYPRPGLKMFSNAGSSKVRERMLFDGDLIVVLGAGLQRITASGNVTTVGTLATVTGSESLTNDRTRFCLVVGNASYV